jgi:host factor-I protein
MSEFETGLPSIRQVQIYIKDKQQVEFKLINNDLLVGTIFWQDPHCICLLDQDNVQITIWRQAIVYLKPKS